MSAYNIGDKFVNKWPPIDLDDYHPDDGAADYEFSENHQVICVVDTKQGSKRLYYEVVDLIYVDYALVAREYCLLSEPNLKKHIAGNRSSGVPTPATIEELRVNVLARGLAIEAELKKARAAFSTFEQTTLAENTDLKTVIEILQGGHSSEPTWLDVTAIDKNGKPSCWDDEMKI